MSPELTDALPNVGRSVELHQQSGRSSLGRVQSAAAEKIVVALPSDAAIAASVGTGAEISLRWSGRGGVIVLPTSVTHRQRSPQLELWDLTPTAAAEFEQRRHQPRVSAHGVVTFTPDRDSDPATRSTLTGTLVDVSESAMQCLLGAGAEDEVLSGGETGTCVFTYAESHFSLHGTVLTAWTEGTTPAVRVVVQFDPKQSELAALAGAVLDSVDPA